MPPPHVVIEETLEGVLVYLPRREIPTRQPVTYGMRVRASLRRRPMFWGMIGIVALVSLLSFAYAGLAAAFLLGLVLVAAWEQVHRHGQVTDILPTAQFSLSGSLLTLGKERIVLDDIARVVREGDAVRLRIRGEERDLLPGRTADERAWAAGVIQEAVARRRAGTTDAERGRQQLAALLKNTPG